MAVLKATTINGNLSVSSSLTTSGMIPISIRSNNTNIFLENGGYTANNSNSVMIGGSCYDDNNVVISPDPYTESYAADAILIGNVGGYVSTGDRDLIRLLGSNSYPSGFSCAYEKSITFSANVQYTTNISLPSMGTGLILISSAYSNVASVISYTIRNGVLQRTNLINTLYSVLRSSSGKLVLTPGTGVTGVASVTVWY